MKILLVANYPIDRQESMLRFGEMMLRELGKLGHDVRLIAPRAILFPNVSRNDGIWKWIGYVNKFVLFPFALRRAARDADIVHVCDHSNAMYIPWLRDRPHLITVHDLIAIRAARGLDASEPVRASGRIFQYLIFRGLTQVQRAVCISSSTRDLLIELAPALKERTTVVHFGQNFPFHPVGRSECDTVRLAFGLGPEPYFLHVGQNHRRKNRVFLLPLLAAMIASRPQLPHRLVLVGSPLGPEEEAAIAANGLGNRVFALGKVGGEELRALYSGAAAMIFPSLLEGFGWPIIEAQACGCPVVTSDRRPMNEIGGEAAIYIDPLDHEGSAQTLLAALPTLFTRRNASLRNAASFSVEKMVDHYLAEYSAAQISKARHKVAAAHVAAPQ